MATLDERIEEMEKRVLNARSVEASRSFHNQLDQLVAQKKAISATTDARLAAAEAVCLMFGWSVARDGTERERATHTLWKRWLDIVGEEFTNPKRHPELNDEAITDLAGRAR